MEQISDGLVSILIPVYNHERYVAQALNSVLLDPYPYKELIIIDDGSTKDNSRVAIEQWIEANSQNFCGRIYFKSRDNRGLTYTLNELITKSQGEFVALLASDDYLLPGGIGKRVEYLQKHTDKMAVFADAIVVDETGAVVSDSGLTKLHRGRLKCLRNDKLLPYELVFRFCVPGPVFMARRSLYEEVGGYDESIAVEDFEFYLRLVQRNVLGFLQDKVAAYRVATMNKAFNSTMIDNAMHAILCKYENQFSGIRRARLLGYRKRLEYSLGKSTRKFDLLWAWLYRTYSKLVYEMMVIFKA